VKPNDIDDMRNQGYLKAGNHIIVHSFKESPPALGVGTGAPPYELHFFPNVGKIQVRGRAVTHKPKPKAKATHHT
jgi:hypothetical protein